MAFGDLPLDVATAVRRAVLPHLGRPEGRGVSGVAVGGDPTFAIDEIAEEAANAILEEASSESPLAWFTEDRGLEVRGRAERILIIDPIDGTRPAGAGLESATVAIASAPYRPDATFGDVDDALVLEIRSGALFRARRDEGVLIVVDGERRRPSPSPMANLEGAFWCYGLRGRPVLPSAVMLEELMDATSARSGTFDLGAAAFALTRLATGQLDAYVDHGRRIIDEIPESIDLFQAVGEGAVLNNTPYDVAAAALICEEAGCVVTDAHGAPLDDHPLIGSGHEEQVSTLAACTPELHEALLDQLDRGMERVHDVWRRGGFDAGDAAAAGRFG